jgi:hypothetical protein
MCTARMICSLSSLPMPRVHRTSGLIISDEELPLYRPLNPATITSTNSKSRKRCASGTTTGSTTTYQTHLEPDHNQVPKSNHAQIRRTISLPRTSILDRDDIHCMQHALHGEKAEYKAEAVGCFLAPWDGYGVADLFSASSPSTAGPSSLVAIPTQRGA